MYAVFLHYGLDDCLVAVKQHKEHALKLAAATAANPVPARQRWEKLMNLDIGLPPAAVSVAELTPDGRPAVQILCVLINEDDGVEG